MNLLELAIRVNDSVRACVNSRGDPAKTDVLIIDGAKERMDEEVDVAFLEEFADDEETYRQHVRVGGEREFTFQIRTVPSK